MARRGLFVLFVLLVACTPGASAARPPQRVHLSPCRQASDYLCGTVRVALDPAGEVPGKIDIAFAWLPHANSRAKSSGTIVAVEGGPGYPSIASRSLYRALYAPLLGTRDLLLVDNRGTGSSAPIVCRPLQRAPLMVLRDVTSCGRRLGRASDLFGTALAADDMAAIFDALGIDRADMYGDSYGTFFVQAFAGRHPERVRSLVLDGAYAVTGGNPWYPSTGPTMRRAFETACERSPVCAHLPGSPARRIERLLATLRADRGAKITPSNVAFVMDSAGLDPIAYRDLDAAVRAYLEQADRAPLVRLVDEAYGEEEGAGGGAHGYSQGLFAAASCSDNPQVYDMRLPPRERSAEWERELARKSAHDPGLFAPFRIDEFLGIPIDYAYVPLCTTWPVASAAHPPGEPVPPGTRFPDVPVLVLTGDLDTITTSTEGDEAAALFSHAVHVIVANTGHVSALDDFYGCASSIVRRFTESGSVEGQCASTIPAMHLVPSFSRMLAEVDPAAAERGNRANEKQLRAAAAATLAAADVLARAYQFGLTSGSGLRGGSFAASPKNATAQVHLSRVQWTNDLAVSGTASLNAKRQGAQARLTLRGAVTGTLDAVWPTTGSNARASLAGTLDGREVRASMFAP